MRDQLSGVIVLNKPADISSAKVVSKVKKLLDASKVGHTGTLDPFATGVLVCCLNQATRLAAFFLHSDKTYEAVMRLGIATDTQDATGSIVRQAEIPATAESGLEAIFEKFIGHQMQQPPIHAALKHRGTPLYKLARQGTPVRKPARAIVIASLRILEVDLPRIRFEVCCSAGTYIRTLCADIGDALGCGAHLEQLHRTLGGGFGIDEAITLESLTDLGHGAWESALIPMGAALRGMPVFSAEPGLLQRVAFGQTLTQAHVPATKIEKPADAAYPHHVKIVDGAGNLKAVLQKTPDGTGYNYCCVFK